MLPLLVLLLLVSGAAQGTAGEKAPPAPKPGEVEARLVSLPNPPFITPRQAKQEFTKVTVADGAGSMPVAGLKLKFNRGVMAVVEANSTVKSPVGVTIPQKGFSNCLAANVSFGDGTKGSLAFCFRWTGKSREYDVRNMTVAAGQYGDHPVVVIDDNCNGHYNDVGEDAVLVDRGRLAVPLGSVVLFRGAPHKIEVSESGRKMTFTPVPDFKPGCAIVSRDEGDRLLIGAVLKGPLGGFHAINDRGPTVLPAGSYTLTFASLGNPVINRLAVLDAKGTSLKVEPGNKPAVLTFGRPKLKISVVYNEARDRVVVKAPREGDISCKAGGFRFFFPMTVPEVDITRIGKKSQHRQERSLKMPFNTRAGQPRDMELWRNRHNLDRGKKYRFDMRWATGVIEEVSGSATLVIPQPPPPPPKKK